EENVAQRGTGCWPGSAAGSSGECEGAACPACRPAVKRRPGRRAYDSRNRPGWRQGPPRIERIPPRPCSGHREGGKRVGRAARARLKSPPPASKTSRQGNVLRTRVDGGAVAWATKDLCGVPYSHQMVRGPAGVFNPLILQKVEKKGSPLTPGAAPQ